MRIVFMGTPDFALHCLQVLVEHGYNIVGVITAPNKNSGRGQKLQKSPVKQYAEKKGLKILEPINLKSPHFLEELALLKADLQIVVAFRMLPEVVWAMPSNGTINLHASLLPQYRGAAPINWAIINGEKKTGITTFFINHQIDTGDLLFQEEVNIADIETAGTLHDKLMVKGADLVVRTVQAIADGNIVSIPQIQNIELKHAPKIFKKDCEIDWFNDVITLHNMIRGLSPYPAAFTTLHDKVLKIYGSNYLETKHTFLPGKIESDNKNYLRYYANNGYLDLNEIQLEGKNRMSVHEFLRGFKI